MAAKMASADKIRIITSMSHSLSSGVMINANIKTTREMMIPTRAVSKEILLSGMIAPTPITVSRYLTRSKSSVESFSRLLWCARFT